MQLINLNEYHEEMQEETVKFGILEIGEGMEALLGCV